MNRALPVPSQHLLESSSGQIAKALVAIIDAESRDSGPDNFRNRFGQRPKSSFTLAGNRFLPLGTTAANEMQCPIKSKQHHHDRKRRQVRKSPKSSVECNVLTSLAISDTRRDADAPLSEVLR
jgi:hypothetical protein